MTHLSNPPIQQRPIVPPLEQYENMVHKLAWAALKRAKAAGIPFEIEDLRQEIAVTYCRCRDNFNPDAEGAASFFTFFYQAAYHNLSALFVPYTRRNKHGFTFSGDAAVETDDGGIAGIWEAIPGDQPTPDQYIECEELLSDLMSLTSPMTRALLYAQLSDQLDVDQQLEVLNAGIKIARGAGDREPGVRQRGFAHATFHFMTQAFGLDRDEAVRAKREINDVLTDHFCAGE